MADQGQMIQPGERHPEDAEILAALRRRDERVFLALIRQHHAALLQVAMLYVPSRAVADEVVQDTWLALLRGLDRFEGRSSLRTYLFAIVRNIARQRARSERRTAPFSTLDAEDARPLVDPGRFAPNGHRWAGHWWPDQQPVDPADMVVSTELQAVVAEVIRDLPRAQREVITLRDLAGCSAHEVCELLELSDANQRVLLHRARARVRRVVEHYLDETTP